MSENLLKSTSTVGSMTFISRILGFIRDMVSAGLFGATAGYDAFLVAFKIPNFLRSLFAEGAFSQAFVPLLSAERVENSPENTKQFIDKVAGCLAVVCFVVTCCGVLAAPWIIRLFAPGFSQTEDRLLLATHMLRITFPYLFFITMTALGGGILNTYGKFAPPAFTPVLLNICMILTAVFISPYCAEPVEALAIGVFLGGVVQMFFQVPFLKSLNLIPRLRPDFKDIAVKRVLKQMVPALVGVSVVQINMLLSTLFASFLPVGSVSWLYYADRLMQFPLGVFGVALTTVVLPHLSRRYAEHRESEYSKTLAWAFNMALLIALPAAVGLYLLATPLLSTLFQYGRFSAEDVLQTSGALQAYAIGISAFILVKVLAAAFYARRDIKTPVKIAVCSLIVNIIGSATLIHLFAHIGLAMANTMAALVNVFLLLLILMKRGLFRFTAESTGFMVKIICACALMALFLITANPKLNFWLDGLIYQKTIALSGLLISSVLLYFGLLWMFGMRWQVVRHEVS